MRISRQMRGVYCNSLQEANPQPIVTGSEFSPVLAVYWSESLAWGYGCITSPGTVGAVFSNFTYHHPFRVPSLIAPPRVLAETVSCIHLQSRESAKPSFSNGKRPLLCRITAKSSAHEFLALTRPSMQKEAEHLGRFQLQSSRAGFSRQRFVSWFPYSQQLSRIPLACGRPRGLPYRRVAAQAF